MEICLVSACRINCQGTAPVVSRKVSSITEECLRRTTYKIWGICSVTYACEEALKLNWKGFTPAGACLRVQFSAYVSCLAQWDALLNTNVEECSYAQTWLKSWAYLFWCTVCPPLNKRGLTVKDARKGCLPVCMFIPALGTITWHQCDLLSCKCLG